VNGTSTLPDAEALANLIAVFEQISPDNRDRIFRTLGAYLGFGQPGARQINIDRNTRPDAGATLASYTEDRSLTPKEFMLQKQPPLYSRNGKTKFSPQGITV
jgi:hypothetical protein